MSVVLFNAAHTDGPWIFEDHGGKDIGEYQARWDGKVVWALKVGYVIVLFFVSTSHSNVEVVKNIDLKLIQFKHWNRPGFHCFNHFAMQLFIRQHVFTRNSVGTEVWSPICRRGIPHAVWSMNVDKTEGYLFTKTGSWRKSVLRRLSFEVLEIVLSYIFSFNSLRGKTDKKKVNIYTNLFCQGII